MYKCFLIILLINLKWCTSKHNDKLLKTSDDGCSVEYNDSTSMLNFYYTRRVCDDRRSLNIYDQYRSLRIFDFTNDRSTSILYNDSSGHPECRINLDSIGRLQSFYYRNNDSLEGPFVNFYDNGIPKSVHSYHKGITTGGIYEYDSLGKRQTYAYKDNWGEQLVFISYDSLGKISLFSGSLRPVTSEYKQTGEHIFYMIQPPYGVVTLKQYEDGRLTGTYTDAVYKFKPKPGVKYKFIIIYNDQVDKKYTRTETFGI